MTTLNLIRSHRPCMEGWTKLLKHLNKTSADDEPLSLLTILDSNGVDDAIWCLRTEPTPERIHRFALAVARRVEHHHPQAKATLDVVERYLSGQATKVELYAAAEAAADTIYKPGASRAANIALQAAANTALRAADRTAFRAAARAADAAREPHLAARFAAHLTAYEVEREAQAQIFREIFA